MITADQLLDLARVYGAATGVALTTVGRHACDNDKVFTRLEQGRGCNLLSAERAWKWFAENWPPGLSWPASVPRAVSRDAA